MLMCRYMNKCDQKIQPMTSMVDFAEWVCGIHLIYCSPILGLASVLCAECYKYK